MAEYTTLNNRPLMHWHTVKIETRGSSKFVTFTSRIHVNKEHELPFQFALSFTDAEILRDRDVIRKFCEYYGPDAIK